MASVLRKRLIEINPSCNRPLFVFVKRTDQLRDGEQANPDPSNQTAAVGISLSGASDIADDVTRTRRPVPVR
jgi:hypothetical protein